MEICDDITLLDAVAQTINGEIVLQRVALRIISQQTVYLVCCGVMAQRVVDLRLGVVVVIQIDASAGDLTENISNSVVDFDFIVVVVGQISAVCGNAG